MFKACVLTAAIPAAALAAVFTYEANVLPEDGGWILVQTFCNPKEWLEDGQVVHHVEPEPQCDFEGDSIDYRRQLTEFVGEPMFFVEWRMRTDGSSDEFPVVAPAAFVVSGQTSVAYHFTIANDQVRLWRDNSIPFVFFDIDRDVMHTYRLEHYGDDLYIWFVDGEVADSGVPEGFYPSNISNVIAWRTKSWFLESTAKWDYMRFGQIPIDGSGDFDSDGDVDGRDFLYFAECVADRGNGPGIPVDPGCEFSDMDSDGDVDFADFAVYQRVQTEGGE